MKKTMSPARRLGSILTHRSLTIATAESCTGGLIGALITSVPGSSAYFDRGFITYSNRSKIEALTVDQAIIDEHGAVSAECAAAMASGLRQQTGCDICIATTGIAGPGGGTYEKPVGLVYAGFFIGETLSVERLFFKGGRDRIRKQTADFCLRFVITALKQWKKD